MADDNFTIDGTPKVIDPVQRVKATDSKKHLTVEYGRSTEQLVSTFYNEERKIDDLTLRDYRMMKDNDGQVQMLLNAVNNTILSVGFEIIDDPDFEATDANPSSEEKLFIEKNLKNSLPKGGMSTSIGKTNKNFLRALEEGYRVYEIVYKLNEEGKYIIDKIAPRAAQSGRDRDLEIIVDNNGNFLGFHQKGSFKSQTLDIVLVNESEIPKALLVVFGSEYGSNYGRSALKPIFYHYDKAHKGMYLNHIGHELGAIKFRNLKKKGGGDTQKDALMQNFLEKVGLNSWIMYDENEYELVFEDVSDANVMKVGLEMIEYHTGQMAKAWLAQFVDLGTTSSGNRALGESQIDFFKTGLQTIAQVLIEDPWNHMIAGLIKLNFDNKLYPTLKVNEIDSDTASNLYNIFAKLVEKGTVNDSVVKRITERATKDLDLGLTDQELEEPIEREVQVVNNPNQAKPRTNLTESIKLADEAMEAPVRRPLFPDEEKVKLADISRRLSDAEMNARMALASKLSVQKDEIVNQYILAVREGRRSIKKVNINLEENKYSEALALIAFETAEFGKLLAANEILEKVPTTNGIDRAELNDYVENIVEEQSSSLGFRLRNVANTSLKANIPENQTKMLMEQEYNKFWDVKLVPTIFALIPFSLNFGRSITFKKYSEKIFAYRYTAVLDDRTTEYCRTLDGTVLQRTDPNYAALTPPNHFGCRSFWTPITIEESKLYNTRVNGKPNNLPIYSSISTFEDLSNVDMSDKEFEKTLLALAKEHEQH